MALVRRSRMEQESRKISKDAPNADRPLRQGTGHEKASGKAGHGRNHPLYSVLDPYYSNVALLGVLLDEVQEALPIGDGGKDGLFVIATLGEVEPVARRGEAKSAGLIVPSMHSGFRRRIISLIFEKNARWSLKIRTTMAVSQ